jgi:hypothetical protein
MKALLGSNLNPTDFSRGARVAFIRYQVIGMDSHQRHSFSPGIQQQNSFALIFKPKSHDASHTGI